uniref:Uncharacterized protein n=1 Tax=Panagrolaimus sp. JU765 TaxID=591449 RepID=A0AC34RTI1_9BILA
MPRRKNQPAYVMPVKELPPVSEYIYDLYHPVYEMDRNFNADSIRRFVSVTGSIKYSLLEQLIQLFYNHPLDGTILRRMLDRQTYSLTAKAVFERHEEYRVENDPENPKDFIIHKIK